jgi:hypothetical protein
MQQTVRCECGSLVQVDIAPDEDGASVSCFSCGKEQWVPGAEFKLESKLESDAGESVPSVLPSTAHNVAVRLITFLIPAVCLAYFIGYFVKYGGSQHDEGTSQFLISMLASALLGIPSVYICIKGPLAGEEARENRYVGIIHVLLGGGLLIGAGLVNLVLYWIGSSSGLFLLLWYGPLGIGAVGIALGCLEILCGRDLVDELGGKQQQD